MRLGSRLRLRLLMAAPFASVVTCIGCVELHERTTGALVSAMSFQMAVVALAAVGPLLALFFQVDRRIFEAECRQFFGPSEFEAPGTDWQRWPKPPRRQRRPKVFDEPEDTAVWMERLAGSYARLAKFEELKAPANVIAQERRMIRERIAKLSPAEALSVMRSWPQLVDDDRKKRRKVPPAGESN